MYLSSHDKSECCGCGGCQQICPVHCITMTVLDDGFIYPEIDEESCVHCDKCVNVCPIYQSEKTLQGCQTLDCYYGWHKNESTRMQSTSGGAFSAIAELVLENNNSSVYGALYDDDFCVRHRGIDSQNGLDRLRQSKYIQSDLGNCYSEIRQRLNHHEKVLFCGTPCQCDGLRLFLGKEHEKLLIVEFICHGVTSPAIFKTYIRHLEKKYGSRIKMFRFRDKITVGNVSSLGYTSILFENGRRRSSESNLYLHAYINGLMQRVCCEKCPYASHYRRSDITLGDFWGIEDIIPRLKDEFNKGISLIMSNTEKGRAICGKLTDRMYLIQTEVSYAFNGNNMQLEKPVQANKKKRQLYSDVNKVGIQLALAKALGFRRLLLMYYGWCKNTFKAYLPQKVYRWIVLLKHTLR